MKGWILLSIFLIVIPISLAIDIYEPDDSYLNSTYLEVNGTRQEHTFHIEGDKDFINFTTIAGSRYIIETFNKSDIDITDTIVYLYSTDGTTEITNNDDIINGVIRTSRISWNATSNGTFFLRVIEFSNNSGGNYEISVTRLGKLEPFLISPINMTEKIKFNTFEFSSGVRCSDGYCYNISAYLDPEAAELKEFEPNIEPEVSSSIEKNRFADVIITIANKDSISLNQNIPQQQSNFLSSLNLKKDFRIKYRYSTLPMVAGRITAEGLNKIKKNNDVIFIELDRPIKILLDSSIPIIKANQVWSIVINNSNLTGNDETICIIDTGIRYTHSAFGSCAITADINNGSCPKVVGGHDFVNNDNDPDDDHGHGTHVAGIAASEDTTYRGVAPGARIVAIKSISSSGSGSSSDVIAGIDWCTNNATKFNISVISMSLGENGIRFNEHCNTNAEAASINNAVLNNIFVASAAGNDGFTDGVTSPACVENATSVGGTDDSDNFNYNRGFILGLVAPALSIMAPSISGSFTTLSGTSMSTPHVAGAAAIIRQNFRLRHNRTITPSEIKHILRYNGVFLNDIPSSTVHPRINVEKAASAKGLIPTTVGARPFYTLSSNPHNESCLQFISDGETCNQTWIVNVTGEINSTWEFFIIYEGKYHFNITNKVNITIISMPSVQGNENLVLSINNITQNDTIELGDLQMIFVNVTGTNLSYVNISINNENVTMNLVDRLYNYSYTPFGNGTINYTIYVYDTSNNSNFTVSGFFVNDTTNEPLFYYVNESNNTINFNEQISIFSIILDGFDIIEVLLDYNTTKIPMTMNSRYNFNHTFNGSTCGNTTYTLSAKNSINFTSFLFGNFFVTNCCGNNLCESGESCSTCSEDCNPCPAASSSSGSSGGGGGDGGGGFIPTGRSILNKTNLTERLNITFFNQTRPLEKSNLSVNKTEEATKNPITGAAIEETSKHYPKKLIFSIASLLILIILITLKKHYKKS